MCRDSVWIGAKSREEIDVIQQYSTTNMHAGGIFGMKTVRYRQYHNQFCKVMSLFEPFNYYFFKGFDSKIALMKF